ncbi:TetR/AcrR family transcriptional regulator [Klenkia sp. PcliD-1-E]|uniref:TetR/AcrR family transcriptional regulator n=1 Tax=Klenkia sp. PcliD-1-E TaxID=2954492 RepID=UPI0020980E62|nr:TetR/AcrR family transcriptional regulator [Klenkia sp. PcliD-1-E]MCO7218226.1 TetR/AcrR family transcriptional regulator [Klenkia sp. PcliD-1-E]
MVEQVRRTQQQRRAETERRVVDAAIALIAERGSRAVTLAEVGQAAGYSRGIVHAHFGSRDQLLAAVVRDAQRFDVPEVDGTGLDRLAALVRAYLQNVALRRPAIGAFLLMWAESRASDPVLGPLFAERDRSFRADLAAVVRDGVQDGSVRRDADPEAVAVLLLGALRGIGMQQAGSAGAVAGDGMVEQTVAVLVQGLGSGPQPA